MQKLLVQSNQLDYVAFFSQPGLGLWGEGTKILQGLFSAFSPFHINLADLRNDSSSLHPSDQVVTVRFGAIGEYRFKFDRVELTLLNFNSKSLVEVPKVLTAGDEWLRSVIPGFTFSSHLFATLSHSELDHGTSQEFCGTYQLWISPELESVKEAGLFSTGICERRAGECSSVSITLSQSTTASS